MTPRDLIEVAALVAAHGPVLIEGPAQISTSALEQYWAASKCRLDRWLRALKKFAGLREGEDDPSLAMRSQIRSVLEEILLAELPLRVWTAVLYGYDRRRGTNDAEPIARSVFLGHLEVRQRALALLIHSPHLPAEDAVALNRLRRRVERWTDVLLAALHVDYGASELAFEADRCREFAGELRDRRGAASQQTWNLMLASLRVAFQHGVGEFSPNEDSHHDIAAGILACFPAELFDGTGVMSTLWQVRLAHSTSDAQGLLEQLLHDPPPQQRASLRLSRAAGAQPPRRFD